MMKNIIYVYVNWGRNKFKRVQICRMRKSWFSIQY
jgi:hypothetical protein